MKLLLCVYKFACVCVYANHIILCMCTCFNIGVDNFYVVGGGGGACVATPNFVTTRVLIINITLAV